MDNLLKQNKVTIEKKYVIGEGGSKDLTTISSHKTSVIYEDDQGTVYPTGKVVLDELTVTKMDYVYNKDKSGNITSCIVTTTVSKNDKPVGAGIPVKEERYDGNGNLIKIIFKTNDGLVINKRTYEYDEDNNVVKSIDKSMTNVRTTTYHNKEVLSIVDETISSKMAHNVYKADFDSAGRLYHVHDGDKNLDIDIERGFDDKGNVILEVKRFFETVGFSSKKKLISYISKSFIPSAGYKLGMVIKNGMLTEKHSYDTNGEEIEMFTIDNNKEYFTRKSSEVSEGKRTETETKRVIDLTTGDIVETETIKKVYDVVTDDLLSIDKNGEEKTEYEYDTESRVTKITTDRLIADEWVTVNVVEYEYTTTTVKRTLTVYDENEHVTSTNVDEKLTTELLEKHTDVESLFKTED